MFAPSQAKPSHAHDCSEHLIEYFDSIELYFEKNLPGIALRQNIVNVGRMRCIRFDATFRWRESRKKFTCTQLILTTYHFNQLVA